MCCVLLSNVIDGVVSHMYVVCCILIAAVDMKCVVLVYGMHDVVYDVCVG